jgi:hypothetical protein
MRSHAAAGALLLLMSLGLGLKFASSKRAWGIARPKRDGESPWDKVVPSDQPLSHEAALPPPLFEETHQRKKTWALERPKSGNRPERTTPRATRRWMTRNYAYGASSTVSEGFVQLPSVHEPSQHTFRLSKQACSWELAKYAVTYSKTHRCRCVEWQTFRENILMNCLCPSSRHSVRHQDISFVC